jgi:serine/threonine-protein kinase
MIGKIITLLGKVTVAKVQWQISETRYQIIRLIGRGGFGTTYLAQDTQRPGNPECIVKHFTPLTTEPTALKKAEELFTREAETLDTLGTHSQIPTLLAHISKKRNFFIVQEYIEGHDLTKELSDHVPLSEDYVIILLKQILEVLAYIHDQKVIHRDLKPSNIRRRTTDNQIVIIDFGAVKQVSNQQSGNQNPTVIGTYGYTPIEQAQGKPVYSSDIYAVGMIGIQAVTGQYPPDLELDKEGKVLWRNHIKVSDQFAAILDKMVDYHHRNRYPTAREALAAFKQIAPTIQPFQNISILPTLPPSQNISTLPTSLPYKALSVIAQIPQNQSKNRHLFLKIAPVGLMIIIGVIVFLQRPIPECDGKLAPYSNSEYPLSIDYPECWQKDDTPDATNGTIVTFSQTQKKANLIIRRFEHSGDLPDYQKNQKQIINNTFDAPEIITEEVKVASQTGRKIIFTTVKNGKEKIKNMYLMTLRGNQAYLIIYTAPMDDYDKFLPTAEKMIDSLKIN